ncbi:MAG: hypothetical protein CMJ64_28970 [Planctomycetaceae bacterium]|nr:hypothetical protein [Planctomycetaceae bacterium]
MTDDELKFHKKGGASQVTTTWIERDFTRTDVADIDDAKRVLQHRWPDAVFLEQIEVGTQRVMHVHARPRKGDDRFQSPDAVIVQQ